MKSIDTLPGVGEANSSPLNDGFPLSGKKILVFFPQNLYPPRTGAHKHCMETLLALRELGCAITLTSTNLFASFKWDSANIHRFELDTGIRVVVYYPSLGDRCYRLWHKFLNHWQKCLSRLGLHVAETVLSQKRKWGKYSPPGLSTFFSKVTTQIEPDVILINYSMWGRLVQESTSKKIVTILDVIDLFSLAEKMLEAVLPFLPHKKTLKIDERLIEENFFKERHIVPDRNEYEICDHFDYVRVLSQTEAKLLKENCTRAKIRYAPVVVSALPVLNTYQGAAVFVISNNCFNLQGYFYFQNSILPLILKSCPDFHLDVLGDGCAKLFTNCKNISLLGYVPDIAHIYRSCRFAICPLLGATGQQVKIVEALAHGIPIVVHQNVAQSSPVVHGVNGFVANNAQEFADYSRRLWCDHQLCQKMGQAGKRLVDNEFNRNSLKKTFLELLSEVHI